MELFGPMACCRVAQQGRQPQSCAHGLPCLSCASQAADELRLSPPRPVAGCAAILRECTEGQITLIQSVREGRVAVRWLLRAIFWCSCCSVL